VGVALGWSRDALVAPAVGVVVGGSELLGVALGVSPAADAVAVGVGVGRSLVGAVGVGCVVEAGVDKLDGLRVGMALGEAVADGDGAVPSRRGDGTGRGRVLAPAGPTGATVR